MKMKTELKKGLKEYFGIVKERNNYVKKQFEKFKLFYEIDDRIINKRIGAIAIGFLNKRNWDFEKDRTKYSSQLSCSIPNNNLCLRKYRHKSSYTIHFLDNKDSDTKEVIELLPNGFEYAIQEINKIIEEHNKHKNRFEKEKEDNYGYGYRRTYGYPSYYDKKEIIKVELKGKFDIVNDYGNKGIESEKIENITALCNRDGKSIEIKFGDNQLLYYDKVYNKVLEVIEKLRQMDKEAKERYDKVMAELNELSKENKFKSLMVVDEL